MEIEGGKRGEEEMSLCISRGGSNIIKGERDEKVKGFWRLQV